MHFVQALAFFGSIVKLAVGTEALTWLAGCRENKICIPTGNRQALAQLDYSSISRLGRSSVERVFSDDLRPDGREQPGMKQSV